MQLTDGDGRPQSITFTILLTHDIDEGLAQRCYKLLSLPNLTWPGRRHVMVTSRAMAEAYKHAHTAYTGGMHLKAMVSDTGVHGIALLAYCKSTNIGHILIFGLVIFGRSFVAAEILFCKVQCDNIQTAAVQAENVMWLKCVLLLEGLNLNGPEICTTK